MAKAKKPTADDILTAALAMGEEMGWPALSLSDLARRLRMPLNDLRDQFADTDALANAWFATATEAMLAPPAKGFGKLDPAERLRVLMLRWFDALAPHRPVTVDMLRAKLHPPHMHHWGPMPFHLSKLIQLMRDTAGFRSGGRRRQIEEIGMTSLFLMTLRIWCSDDSPGQERTRACLDKRLAQSDFLMARLFGRIKKGERAS